MCFYNFQVGLIGTQEKINTNLYILLSPILEAIHLSEKHADGKLMKNNCNPSKYDIKVSCNFPNLVNKADDPSEQTETADIDTCLTGVVR